MITLDNIDNLSNDDIGNFLSQTLNILLQGNNLDGMTMQGVMLAIMHGRCPDALMAAILVALRIKGESIDEITAAATVMKELAHNLILDDLTHAVDIVGTGGDGASLFNISTAAAFVVSASGATVAKHGNRGVSTKSGSSDLLEALGVRLDLSCDEVTQCIHQQRLGFLFAPNHHKAMRYAIGVRQQLKTRTIFNILGPLTNPAGVINSVIGVFDQSLCEPLAYALRNLGSKHALVVHSSDGLDEFSVAGDNFVSELKDGIVTNYTLNPTEVGIKVQNLDGLVVSSSQDSLTLITQALSGISDNEYVKKAQDIIAFNAGVAIYAAGKAKTIHSGVKIAQNTIYGGLGLTKMQTFAKFTQSLKAQ